jgi:phosphatidylinositol-3-phosphatase
MKLKFLLPLIFLSACGCNLDSSQAQRAVMPQISTQTAARPPRLGHPDRHPIPPAQPAPAPQPPSPPPTPPPAPPPPSQTPSNTSSPHIFLIIEENRSFSTVYPTGMPWLSALGDANGIATNYLSDEGGSLHAYLWLSSGSGENSFGCGGGTCTEPITSDNIFRELDKAGFSWRVYAESLPYAGFMGGSYREYVRRHNPAPFYSDVIKSKVEQLKIVPFKEFAIDLAAKQLPAYSIIVPNLLHDAHNGTPASADAWLKQNISPLLDSSLFQPGGDGVLFITFDNADGDAQGHVLTAVIGPRVIPKTRVSQPFRHENTLRTIMELLGLTNFPGASATASPMTEFFK